jgi:hypothetical protein
MLELLSASAAIVAILTGICTAAVLVYKVLVWLKQQQ